MYPTPHSHGSQKMERQTHEEKQERQKKKAKKKEKKANYVPKIRWICEMTSHLPPMTVSIKCEKK